VICQKLKNIYIYGTATPESKFDWVFLPLKKATYDKAVNYFGNGPSYGLGLALLLKGDVNKQKLHLMLLRLLIKVADFVH